MTANYAGFSPQNNVSAHTNITALNHHQKRAAAPAPAETPPSTCTFLFSHYFAVLGTLHQLKTYICLLRLWTETDESTFKYSFEFKTYSYNRVFLQWVILLLLPSAGRSMLCLNKSIPQCEKITNIISPTLKIQLN